MAALAEAVVVVTFPGLRIPSKIIATFDRGVVV
jgi:hypothetical protein